MRKIVMIFLFSLIQLNVKILKKSFLFLFLIISFIVGIYFFFQEEILNYIYKAETVYSSSYSEEK